MRIDEILKGSEEPVFSFEFFPPKTPAGEANLEESLRALGPLDPAYVSVTYGAGGSTRGKTIDIVSRIRADYGLEAMAHLTCVNATVDELRTLLAVAGGLELALWCDLRVAEEDAVFGVFCRRWGVPLIDGGTVRLPRLIGHSRAMDLILTGRAVGAREALDIGLANRVVPTGQARERAEELAAELAALPQLCLRADRRSALDQWGLTEAAAIDAEFAGLSEVAVESLAGAKRFADGAGRHGAKE